MGSSGDVIKRVSLYFAIVIDYSFMVTSPNYQHFQFNCASRLGNTILAGVESCITFIFSFIGSSRLKILLKNFHLNSNFTSSNKYLILVKHSFYFPIKKLITMLP